MRAQSIRKINDSYRVSQQLGAGPGIYGSSLPNAYPSGKDLLATNDPAVKRTVSEQQFEQQPADLNNIEAKLFEDEGRNDTRLQYTKSIAYRDSNTIKLPDPRSAIQDIDYRMDPMAPAAKRNINDFSLLRDTLPEEKQKAVGVQQINYAPVGPTAAAGSGRIAQGISPTGYSQRAYQFQPSKVLPPNVRPSYRSTSAVDEATETCLKRKVFYCPVWFWFLLTFVLLAVAIVGIIRMKKRSYVPVPVHICPVMHYWNGTHCIPATPNNTTNTTNPTNTTDTGNSTNTTNSTNATSHNLIDSTHLRAQCDQGWHSHNNHCVKCPTGSSWSSDHCQKL